MKERKILYADEGKILTDGEIYASVVYLADGEDESRWREIHAEDGPIEETQEDGTDD